MKNRYNYLIGSKQNALTAIDVVTRPHPTKPWQKQSLIKCKCECGNITFLLPSHFKKGYIKSCGCYRHRSPYNTTHKQSRTPLYHIWETMRLRCSSPNNKKYYMYGARGIKVCDEWFNNFIAFRDWSLSHGWEQGLTLDRIDNNAGYSPDNCRWTTHAVQQRNTRRNVYITYQGKTQILADWCTELGLKYKVIQTRIVNGWDKVRALTEPIRKPKSTAQRSH